MEVSHLFLRVSVEIKSDAGCQTLIKVADTLFGVNEGTGTPQRYHGFSSKPPQ